MAKSAAKDRPLATNRKASHEFFLLDRFEAGLVLQGPEIKSIRAGQMSLQEAYVRLDGGEAWLLNAHVAAYNPASRENSDPRRPRKLLLHRKEIGRLAEQVRQRGFTIVPTRVYLKDGRAKLEIALARGKKQYDKRQAMAARDSRRDLDRIRRRKD